MSIYQRYRIGYKTGTMSKTGLLFIFIIFSFSVQSQSDIAIGQWKSYLPHNAASHVVQSDEKIIYATDQALFTIDKEDNSVEYISTVDGLSETGIESLTYDSFNEQVIIAYDNSVIDILSEDGVFPIFNIKNNTNFIDRSINDMFVQNQTWLYFATGFGLVQYDLINRDFGFTLDARQEIIDVVGNDNYLIISGAEGIYVLDFINETFPNAFTSWRKLEVTEDDTPAQDILFVNNSLYVSTDNQIYKSEDLETFELVYSEEEEGYNNIFLKPYEDAWLVGSKNLNINRSKLLLFDNSDTPISQIDACTNRMLDVAIDERGRVFFADEWVRIRWIDEMGNCNQDFFEGPFSIEATDIDIKDDVVYVASGGITENFADLFGRQGIYILEEGDWNNINQDSNPFYKDNDILQFYQIEAHPTENKYYIGSFWAGVAEYDLDTDEQVLFTDANTGGALGRTVGDEQRTRISGLTFDDDGNLWIALFGGARPLVVRTAEDTWHNFPINADSKLSDIVADDLGFIWGVISGNTGGVIVFDHGQSIPDPSDDKPARFFNLNNSELPSNLVNCIAKDLDGAIWVGTAEGAVVFDCGGSAFENICTGNRRKVLQDSIAAFFVRNGRCSSYHCRWCK